MRTLLAVVCLTTVIALAAIAWNASRQSKTFRDRTFDDLIKAGIELKRSQAEHEFELGLVVFATVWALLIAKKNETQILWSDTPEVIMFVCANLLLLSSFAAYVIYMDYLGYVYSIGVPGKGGLNIPDVFASSLNNPYKLQLWFLLAGIAVSGITLVSAHRLKPYPP